VRPSFLFLAEGREGAHTGDYLGQSELKCVIEQPIEFVSKLPPASIGDFRRRVFYDLTFDLVKTSH
jgi:hypothetical protein